MSSELEGAWFSAEELAAYAADVPGIPSTSRGCHIKARRDGWPARTVQGKGGRDGKKTLYQPPEALMRAIHMVNGGGLSPNKHQDAAVAHRLKTEQPMSDYVAVPLYDGVRAAAGHGALVEHEIAERSVNFSATWLRSTFGARPKDLCMINVTGDSMEPTLRAGDVLLIDCRVLRPDREGIYVVRINDAILVKRVQVLPGGVFRFTSDNPAFQPFNVTPEDESNAPVIIGRALWSGRLL